MESRLKIMKALAIDLKQFLILSACTAFAWAAPGAERPNVIFMMADDLGYGDVQSYNPQSRIPTPHLNRLAEEGMRFTDAHSPSAVCTPTRYGVVTGRYCWRSSLKRGVLNGYGAPFMEPSRPTVATLMREAGYRTAVIGKWHLGLRFGQGDDGENDYGKPLETTPNDFGFDTFFGIPASLDFPPYVYIHNREITAPVTQIYDAVKFPAFMRRGEIADDFVPEESLDTLTQRAVAYLEARARDESQFFLYFPLTAPHKPVLPAQRFRSATDLGPYGDFVAQTDWVVGQVLAALDRTQLAENTLLLFTSDNGSFMYRLDDSEPGHVEDETIQAFRESDHTANGALRGTKADIWEAGHRVPFLARWPGRIESGTVSDTTICHVDLAATLADILDQPLPEDAYEDSFSFLPDLLGQPRAQPRAPVIHHSGSGMFAIRDGQWKLVAGNGSGGRQAPRGSPFERPFFLADLENDLGETSNRAEDFPEIEERLFQTLAEIRESGRSR